VPGGDLLHRPVPRNASSATRFFVRLSEKRDHPSASWCSTINPAGGVPTLYVPRADVAEVQNEPIRYETIETSAAAAENGGGPARARPVSCPILGVVHARRARYVARDERCTPRPSTPRRSR